MDNQWFLSVAGKESGPLTPAQLKAMAGLGRFGPDDLVRRGQNAQWVKAKQVRGLFDVAVTRQRGSSPASKPPAPIIEMHASTAAVSHSADTDQWFFKAGGQEFGPYRFDQLLELARQQRFGPANLVRQGNLRNWILASRIPGLLPSPESVPQPHDAAGVLPQSSIPLRPSACNQRSAPVLPAVPQSAPAAAAEHTPLTALYIPSRSRRPRQRKTRALPKFIAWGSATVIVTLISGTAAMVLSERGKPALTSARRSKGPAAASPSPATASSASVGSRWTEGPPAVDSARQKLLLEIGPAVVRRYTIDECREAFPEARLNGKLTFKDDGSAELSWVFQSVLFGTNGKAIWQHHQRFASPVVVQEYIDEIQTVFGPPAISVPPETEKDSSLWRQWFAGDITIIVSTKGIGQDLALYLDVLCRDDLTIESIQQWAQQERLSCVLVGDKGKRTLQVVAGKSSLLVDERNGGLYLSFDDIELLASFLSSGLLVNAEKAALENFMSDEGLFGVKRESNHEKFEAGRFRFDCHRSPRLTTIRLHARAKNP